MTSLEISGKMARMTFIDPNDGAPEHDCPGFGSHCAICEPYLPKSSSRHPNPHPDSTLEVRAELLQKLLAEDDEIFITLEDARELILAEAAERMLAQVLDTCSV